MFAGYHVEVSLIRGRAPKMYETNFGFHRQPFQCADLTRAFFISESIRSILPQLLHALRSDLGVAVLTGPAGV